MTLLTQREIEERMCSGGIAAARARMQQAEDKGQAQRNAYGGPVLSAYVLPLAELVGNALTKKAGSQVAHVQLLQGLDPDAVALLAVRYVLTSLMGRDPPHLRKLATGVGGLIYGELVLTQIEETLPDLYNTLRQDFGRRMSKDVRHRLTVMKMQAAKNGMTWSQWGPGSRDQVGLFLVDRLQDLGMVVIDAPPARDGKKVRGYRYPQVVRLSEEVMETVDRISAIVEATSPLYGPCVEPPIPWTAFDRGGYHTRAMQRAHPFLAKAHSLARSRMQEADMPVVREAVNALQATAWQVNQRVLDVVTALGQNKGFGEVVGQLPEKPPAPFWLETEGKNDMTPERAEEFKMWKRRVAQWHTDKKLLGAAYFRYYSATRTAREFAAYPSIYFVYFADSRGRLYPLTYGINPQGSDMQKGLLHFAEGEPLDTEESRKWFLIQGANKWGFDKAPLADRAAWARERDRDIMRIASNPLVHDSWQKADNPFQFLAWCFEYADWQIDPEGFRSHIPISMDGSCNGLQNFSAMLRDERGGKATNLTPGSVMQDIYMEVAKATEASIRSENPEYDSIGWKWIQRGITRSVVKRTVMTTPYGVTKRSATKYVLEDNISKENLWNFTKEEYYSASAYLVRHVWKAIGEVVIKSREAMEWLATLARESIKRDASDTPGIYWKSPSGFLASQVYQELDEHRINTRIFGSTKIRVLTEGALPDSTRHAAGLPPNFVHSMDAAHLHLTTVAAHAQGMRSFAMIHDDYGVHARYADKLFRIIREEFVRMYEDHDPIADIGALYPLAGIPPSKGNLNIKEVLQSDYFFS